MNIEGTYTINAPLENVWPMLLDQEVLASAMPGCENLELIGENKYSGALHIQVGPVQGRFSGVITLSNIQEREGYTVTLQGKGAPGFVNGSGKLNLTADGETTILNYTGEAQVGGRLAGVGQRLLETSARAIVRQSLEGLERQIEARLNPEMVGDTAVSPASPTQSEFAAGVAKTMIADMIPAEHQGKLIIGGIAATFAFFFLNMIFVARAMNRARTRRLANQIADILEERAR